MIRKEFVYPDALKDALEDREVTHLTATTSSAHTFLDASPAHLPEKVRRGYVRRARHVTYASLAITTLGGMSGIAAAMSLESAAVLGYALESFVDVWSSVLVLWRFWGDDRKSCDADAVAGRERIANFGISLSFLCISGVVGQEAIDHIRRHRAPDKGSLLLVVAVGSVVVLGILCHLKLDLSRKLRCESLRKDAITSGAVAALSAGIVVSTLMYSVHPQLWWFDSLLALCISLALFAAGMWPLLSMRWWSAAFWAPLTDALGCLLLRWPEHAIMASEA